MPDDPHAGRAMRVGGLYVDDAGRVLMPVAAYAGMYGRQMADCVLVTDLGLTAGTAARVQSAAWIAPMAYFADELSEIAESATDREVI